MRFMWGEGAKGLWVGALIGGLFGLGLCTYVLRDTLLFPGDTILFGAVVCAVLGFLYGEVFFEWLKERWYWFVG